MNDQLAEIDSRLAPLRRALLAHPVYEQMVTLESLQQFMQHHIFAVWDFMSLLKTLQNRLCCNSVPWVPPADGACCRLLNEIVLGEESDARDGAGYASHFELYHSAMQQCGAATDTIDRFVEQLRHGANLNDALQQCAAPAAVQAFVEDTFSLIERGELWEVAAAFVYGREDLLPDVFEQIVAKLNRQQHGRLCDFIYYLQRHIELDGDEHGPMAKRMLTILCGEDDARWQAAAAAAEATLQSRIRLWDAIAARIEKEQQAKSA